MSVQTILPLPMLRSRLILLGAVASQCHRSVWASDVDAVVLPLSACGGKAA